MDRIPEPLRTEAIDLGSIPGLPRIFRDYLLDFDRIAGLYRHDYRDPAGIVGSSETERCGLSDRRELKEALQEQNKSYGCDRSVTENIEKLCHGGCAVLTGQQIGLFCGPLYTVYKAATAVRLAEELNSVGSRKHVPVFWMECEDHDNVEVGRVRVLDPAHEVRTMVAYDTPSRRPTGSYVVDERVTDLLASLQNTLSGARYRDSALSALGDCYAQGVPISVAFARLLSRLFRGKGLVILDPAHPSIKRAASSILLRAVRKWEDVNRAILRASESLSEMGYTPQIEARKERLPLFVIRRGERLSLSYENGGFRDSAGGRVTLAELESLAREEPQALSPNVSLRPIVQDFLLLTSAYVAGPGEIAYFAQIAPLYEVFGINMPVIFPRGLYTLVEPVVARAMEKLGAGVGDFGDVERDLEGVLVRQAGGLRGLEILNRTRSDIERLVDRLQAELTSIEPEISGPFETYRKKTSYQLRKLEEKLKTASDRRHATLLRQVRLARSHLFPLGRPQERVLNTCYCMAHFGDEFVSRLLPDLYPFDFQHKAIWL